MLTTSLQQLRALAAAPSYSLQTTSTLVQAIPTKIPGVFALIKLNEADRKIASAILPTWAKDKELVTFAALYAYRVFYVTRRSYSEERVQAEFENFKLRLFNGTIDLNTLPKQLSEYLAYTAPENLFMPHLSQGEKIFSRLFSHLSVNEKSEILIKKGNFNTNIAYRTLVAAFHNIFYLVSQKKYWESGECKVKIEGISFTTSWKKLEVGPNPKKSISDLTLTVIGQQIGQGSGGKIFAGFLFGQERALPVAVKSPLDENASHSLAHEQQQLLTVRDNPNFVTIHSIGKHQVCERLEIDVDAWGRNPTINGNLRLTVAKKLISVIVDNIKTHKIFLRDLKPANLGLLHSRDSDRIQIKIFDLAQMKKSGDAVHSYHEATPVTSSVADRIDFARQFVEQQQKSKEKPVYISSRMESILESAELFSLATSVCYILSGKYPYYVTKGLKPMYCKYNTPFPTKTLRKCSVPEYLIEGLAKMMDTDTTKRLSLSAVWELGERIKVSDCENPIAVSTFLYENNNKQFAPEALAKTPADHGFDSDEDSEAENSPYGYLDGIGLELERVSLALPSEKYKGFFENSRTD